MGDQPTIETIIMSTLSTLNSSQISSLSQSLSSTFHRYNHHLASLITSPTLFTHTLNHLYSLTLPQKTLLIARHFLSFLRLLTPYILSSSPTPYSNRVRLCDLDSLILLFYFCEVRQHNPTCLDTSPAQWQETLKTYFIRSILLGTDSNIFPISLSVSSNMQQRKDYYSQTMLNNTSRFTLTPSYQVLGMYIDLLIKCRKFINSKQCGIEPPPKEVAASVEAVVALPSVNVQTSGGVECVICKEEMQQGRDVCQLPCQHLFHWMCVLPWLSKRNTCPCCRFLLPTDDVYGEIERLWDAIVKVGLQACEVESY